MIKIISLVGRWVYNVDPETFFTELLISAHADSNFKVASSRYRLEFWRNVVFQ